MTSSWNDYDHELSRIGSEMIGALNYYEANPEHASDARLAECFRQYAGRMAAVERPA